MQGLGGIGPLQPFVLIGLEIIVAAALTGRRDMLLNFALASLWFRVVPLSV